MDLGFRTMEVASGNAAIDALRANLEAIDAVVLDWTMPGLGGAETLRQLRRLRADIPVIEKGAAVFLEKPFTIEALDAALRAVL